ncbi:hypothetical protein [Acinetobacter sp. BSP-28]|uniref:hypothetical protein n=1 Tax=Acinetobacter sp. BSP-28 TaxID=3344661 RepID=UPI0037706D66
MSKYDFENIINNSSYMKAIRAVEDSTYMKSMRAIEDSSYMKVIHAIEDSSYMKAMRAIEDSSYMKAMHAIEDSSYIKAMRAVENSSYMKAMHEMETVLKTTKVSNHYFEIIEERISINDELIGFVQNDNNELNEQSLFINTILFSICILVVNAQVPLDQLLVNLAQNILSSTIFLYLQYSYEASKNSKNGINKTNFKNSRITTESTPLYLNPKMKSGIIENLEQYKFLEIIYEPNLHKSWLKVRTEINDEILEGYILRSYTSPIK